MFISGHLRPGFRVDNFGKLPDVLGIFRHSRSLGHCCALVMGGLGVKANEYCHLIGQLGKLIYYVCSASTRNSSWHFIYFRLGMSSHVLIL